MELKKKVRLLERLRKHVDMKYLGELIKKDNIQNTPEDYCKQTDNLIISLKNAITYFNSIINKHGRITKTTKRKSTGKKKST